MDKNNDLDSENIDGITGELHDKLIE